MTLLVNGNATGGTITVANSGSAAGDVDEMTGLKAIGTNYVNEGDLITWHTDGGCNTTCITRCHAVIRKSN